MDDRAHIPFLVYILVYKNNKQCNRAKWGVLEKHGAVVESNAYNRRT